MKFENNFTVDAPIDRTWETLLDVSRVATCLPGAALESLATDDVYRGSMHVKLGPMTMRYQGTAEFVEVDERTHTTTITVRGKEGGGHGTADATIRSRLESAQRSTTRVTMETDVRVTGRAAQFGRGIIQEVASRMMTDFARRLEQEILSGSTARASADRARSKGSVVAPPAPESLKLGSVLLKYLYSMLHLRPWRRKQRGGRQ